MRRRESQGGFALLMVFLMAAIIALMLYQQLPRVAFESERDKEQLLIDRGEQYTRAIQLYYLANNRQYPTSLDDLEKREKRFLRRRYVDPFTGKDEWRIIHTNGGFLTDSLVQKPVDASSDGKSQSAGNTSNSPTATDEPQVNAAVLQRPSDRQVTPPGFAQPFAGQDSSAQAQNTPLPPITLAPQQAALPPITLQPGVTNQPGGLPPITLTPVGGQPVPGQFPGQAPGQLRPPQLVPGQPPGAAFPGQPNAGGLIGGGVIGGGIQSGTPPPGFRIDANGQLVPIAPIPGQTLGQSIPGQVPGGQLPGFPGQPQAPQPGTPQANQPGAAQGSPNAAVNAINQLLTNPRQTNTAASPITGGNQIGAIAGIASTYKGPSIKVYKDQTKYELWEFVFSPTASTVPGGGAGGPGFGPGGGPGGGPGRGPNQPGGPGAPGGFGGGPIPFGPGGPGGPPQGIGPGAGKQIFGPGPGR